MDGEKRETKAVVEERGDDEGGQEATVRVGSRRWR